MKTRQFLFPFLLLITFVAKSQENSLLWQVTHESYKDTSYLYGTIHLKDKRVFNVGNKVKDALDNSKTVAVEVVTSDIDLQSVLPEILMPKGKLLKDFLPKKRYKIVKAYLDENLGILSQMGERIKPIYTSMLITELQSNKEMSTTLDEFFMSYAKDSNKKLLSIEKAEEQLNAIEDVSIKEQAEMLHHQITEDGKEDGKALEDMIQAYIKQDLKALMDMVNDESTSESFSESLIIERNKTMAKRIAKFAEESSVFAAFGAAHLPGEFGIINELKKAGFAVTPLKSSSKVQLGSGKKKALKWNKITLHNAFSFLLPENHKTIEKTESDKYLKIFEWTDKSQNAFISINETHFQGPNASSAMKNFIDVTKSRVKQQTDAESTTEVQVKKGNTEITQIEYIMIPNSKTIMMLFQKDDICYQVTVSGTSAFFEQETAIKFFNSIEIYQ